MDFLVFQTEFFGSFWAYLIEYSIERIIELFASLTELEISIFTRDHVSLCPRTINFLIKINDSDNHPENCEINAMQKNIVNLPWKTLDAITFPYKKFPIDIFF